MLNNLISLVSALMVGTRNEDGQTMAEYGILIAVIALVVVAVAVFLGSSISALFGSTASHI
jgi:Flp pilus assembly pilin Flp